MWESIPSGKVAVATNDKVHVTGHVGRCKAFIVFETNENEIVKKEIRENTFTHHGRGGHENHEHHHGEGQQHGHENLIEALKDCSHLIFQSGGLRLIENLKENGINPVCTLERDAETAVQKLLKGELVIEEDASCGQH